MILQALTHYYEDLLSLGKMTRPGWATVKVSYGLVLDGEGQLIQLLHLQQEVQRGKKTVLAPQEIAMPAPVKRAVNVAANFLCDNSSYLLGGGQQGKAVPYSGMLFSCQKAASGFAKRCGFPRRPCGFPLF